MSSLTLKGKPSDHAPVASVSSSALTPTSSNASSGMLNDQSLY
jgi:SCY1-like protein 1